MKIKHLSALLLIPALLFAACTPASPEPTPETEPSPTPYVFVAADKQPTVKTVFDQKAVSSAGCLTYAVLENGKLYVWGKTLNAAALGTDPQKLEETPEAGYLTMETPVEVTVPGVDIRGRVKDVQSDGLSTFLLLDNGDLYSWGINSFGCLGDGSQEDRAAPKKIMENVKKVSILEQFPHPKETNARFFDAAYLRAFEAYFDHPVLSEKYFRLRTVYALTNAGELYGWGYNGDGYLFNGGSENSAYPQKITDGVENIEMVDCLRVIKSNGDVLWTDQPEDHMEKTLKKRLTVKETVKKISNCRENEKGDASLWFLLENGELWAYRYDNGSFQCVKTHVKDVAWTTLLLENGELYHYYDQLLLSNVTALYESGPRAVTDDGQAYEAYRDVQPMAIKHPAALYRNHYLDKNGTLYAFGYTDQALGIQLNPGEEIIEMPVQVLFPTGWNQ